MFVYLQNNSERIYRLVMFLICGCIVIWSLSYRLWDKPGLWFGDEFGYFASAAYVTGFDWSSLVSEQLGYYGIGYGLFLIPGFLICKSADGLMGYTVILNVFFSFISYNLCCRLLWKINNRNSFGLCCLASMIATLYINNIVQIHMGWSESINIMIYWLILNAFSNMIEKSRIVDYVVFSVVLSYAVIIHMRNVLFAVAGVLVLIIYLLKEKKFDYKKLIIFGCVALAGAGIFFISKMLVQNTVWVSGEEILVNDVSSVVSNFHVIGHYSTLVDWMKSFLCKLFYIITSTFGLIVCGSIYGFSQKRNYIFYLAFIGCFLEFIYTVYSMQISTRYDAIYYGRYYEPFIGLIICYSIFFLFDLSMGKRKILLACIAVLTLYKICFIVAENMNTTIISYGDSTGAIFPCMSGIAKYIFQKGVGRVPVSAFSDTILYMAIIYGVVLISHMVTKRNSINTVALIFFLIIIIGVWKESSEDVIDTMIAFEEERYDDVYPVYDALNITWKENGNTDIYYYSSGDYSSYVLDLQLLIGRESINSIGTLSKIDCSSKNNIYIVLMKTDSLYESQKQEVLQDGELLVETDMMTMFVYNK